MRLRRISEPSKRPFPGILSLIAPPGRRFGIMEGRLSSSATRIWDSPEGYGLISRLLHWTMAILILAQFGTALLHEFAKDAAFSKSLWPTHPRFGFVLLILVFLRGAWGLANARSRPSHGTSLVGRAAVLGHLALYALMAVVPAIALLRTYGNGYGFTILGVEIFEKTGVQDAALQAPANAAHGLLGWVMLALVAGHVLMALVHRYAWNDDVIGRMTVGRARSSS